VILTEEDTEVVDEIKKISDMTNMELENKFVIELYNFNKPVEALARILRKQMPRWVFIRIILKLRKINGGKND
jgi:hypothetical protein